eukprot:TRINITY_DN27876_c0_g1_i1.p1 TRINITY_DN27876_c0_g1~~TRINITY_DN27876_c0_g1_i1.p1  ORF type:complete len:731 (+),score=83.58 TRINITY_DN27876_c0_g1_i1:48-2195(+)
MAVAATAAIAESGSPQRSPLLVEISARFSATLRALHIAPPGAGTYKFHAWLRGHADRAASVNGSRTSPSQSGRVLLAGVSAAFDGQEHDVLETSVTTAPSDSLSRRVSIRTMETIAIDVDMAFYACESDNVTVGDVVFMRTLLVHVPADGLHEVCPVVFEVNRHFCTLDLEIRAVATRAAQKNGERCDAAASTDTASLAPHRCNPACRGGWIVRELTTQGEATLADKSVDVLRKVREASERRCGNSDSEKVSNALFGVHLVHPSDPRPRVESAPLVSELGWEQPILLERVVEPAPLSGSACAVAASGGLIASNQVHLVALIPCFHGFADDMRMLQNYLGLFLPDVHFAVFNPAENRTEELQIAGVRLAAELSECLTRFDACRLSFVALGSGGLIVRAALPWMQEHKEKLCTFMTISTPHLGLRPPVLSWRAWLSTRAMGALCSGAESQVVDELLLADARTARASLMFRLSGDNFLSLFREVVLVADTHDKLVPVSSALIGEPNTTTVVDGVSKKAPAKPTGNGTKGSLLALAGLDRWQAHVPLIIVLACILILMILPWLSFTQKLISSHHWPRIYRLSMLGLVLAGVKLKGLKTSFDKAPKSARLEHLMALQSEDETDLEAKMVKRMIEVAPIGRVTRVYADIGTNRSVVSNSKLCRMCGENGLKDGLLRRLWRYILRCFVLEECRFLTNRAPFLRTLAFAYAGRFEPSVTQSSQ